MQPEARILPVTPAQSETRAQLALILLGGGVFLAAALFMTLGARGSWAFVLQFRGMKLLGLILIAHAVAVSTVLFQTVTANRILTPSIMGFDALFVLSSTLLIAFMGSVQLSGLDPRLLFAARLIVMTLFSMALYRWLFLGEEQSLHRLLLTGVVFGIFLRTLAEFVQRMLDPNEFMVLSDMLFASFTKIDPVLMGIGWALVLAVTLWLARNLARLDVIGLGRPVAVNLGIRWRRDVLLVLALVSVLVAVSTALVGPVTFFGLLAASLARLAVGTTRHAVLLPAASLTAMLLLIGGQTLLERLFAFNTALGIVIEFFGGVVFLILLLKGGRR
ncbi:iron chelate uptake ABC transporter family permease subunit [Xinfangfangia sp. D13-10-4-6]|uniref:iron chelate uptake ABC transporter family permease subunit n=1 Tax=Pseudogemmobacter hezensis TaxID=2737662 RepID=UPI001556612B|nr:iron chelate uptake ABC transporter family permease subunit [Pseudogemmobacter hezensis]NPD14761.1 iron chelate uptake ABC transporter family permease subunit [Pseudogemmobacter hezensis]